MEGVEVGEDGERPEEPCPVLRSAEAASELGLEAGSGAGTGTGANVEEVAEWLGL